MKEDSAQVNSTDSHQPVPNAEVTLLRVDCDRVSEGQNKAAQDNTGQAHAGGLLIWAVNDINTAAKVEVFRVA